MAKQTHKAQAKPERQTQTFAPRKGGSHTVEAPASEVAESQTPAQEPDQNAQA